MCWYGEVGILRQRERLQRECQKGFTLIEVLVSLVVVTLVAAVIFDLIYVFNNGMTTSQRMLMETYLLQAGVEYFKAAGMAHIREQDHFEPGTDPGTGSGTISDFRNSGYDLHYWIQEFENRENLYRVEIQLTRGKRESKKFRFLLAQWGL